MSNYSLVKRCNYCGVDFTDWHECLGTERARHKYNEPEKQSADQQFIEQLERLLDQHGLSKT